MKKVTKVRWHGVVRETLKAQASNFVLDPRFNWKPVECPKQWICTHMPGLTEDYLGSMIMYCAEVYSVCCQGDQQVENSNNLTLCV